MTVMLLFFFSEGSPPKVNKMDNKAITSKVNNICCFI